MGGKGGRERGVRCSRAPQRAAARRANARGRPAQGRTGSPASHCSPLATSVTKTFAPPPALSANAAPNRLEVVLELIGWRLQHGDSGGAWAVWRRQLEEFLGPYQRAASWTRGGPAHSERSRPPRGQGVTSLPPSRSPPGSPGVLPSTPHRDGYDMGRGLRGAQHAPGNPRPGPP